MKQGHMVPCVPTLSNRMVFVETRRAASPQRAGVCIVNEIMPITKIKRKSQFSQFAETHGTVCLYGVPIHNL